MLIERSDFTGIFELPQNNFNQEKLEAIIEDVEERILRSLLGDHVYLDLATNYETEQDYIDLLDGKDYSIDSVNYRFEGMKKALKYFVWFEFMRDRATFASDQGIMESDVDAAKKAKQFGTLSRMYNRGVIIYNAANTFIQDYLVSDQESENFENMDFTELEKTHWI